MKLPSKFRPMFEPKRIKVYFGGRGGAKTESFCRVALAKAATEGWKFLCLREFWNSIDDSVHSTLKSVIEQDGLSDRFEVQKTRILGPKGDSFRYGQLNTNLSSIKSKFAYKVAWVEEAEDVSEESIDTLEPTIRAAGSEIWYSFNPVREDGAVYSKYVAPYLEQIERDGYYEDDDIYVCKVGLEDNPFAPQELKDASARLRDQDFDKWNHIYGGYPKRELDNVIIQPKWVEAAIGAHEKLNWSVAGVKSVGSDLADEGEDAKAVAAVHGPLVLDVRQRKSGDIEDALSWSFDVVDEFNAEFLVYDADGLGASMKVGLDRRLGGRRVSLVAHRGNDSVYQPKEVYPIDSDPSDKYAKRNKDVFKNRRAQYWWFLADRFERTYNAVKRGVYSDPSRMISLSSEIKDINLLKSELTRVQRKKGEVMFKQVESKKDMATRKVKSPNMADALVMAFAYPLKPEPERSYWDPVCIDEDVNYNQTAGFNAGI